MRVGRWVDACIGGQRVFDAFLGAKEFGAIFVCRVVEEWKILIHAFLGVVFVVAGCVLAVDVLERKHACFSYLIIIRPIDPSLIVPVQSHTHSLPRPTTLARNYTARPEALPSLFPIRSFPLLLPIPQKYRTAPVLRALHQPQHRNIARPATSIVQPSCPGFTPGSLQKLKSPETQRRV